jgi:hemin uptake protein HemP
MKDNPFPVSPPVPKPAVLPTRAQESQREVVLSQQLLGERRWVLIEHEGQIYRLQATRQGKLILTK